MQVTHLNFDDQSITMEAIYNSKQLFFTVVYGQNRGIQRRNLWSKLRRLAQDYAGKHWILVGDFSCILNMEESSDGSGSPADIRDFKDCLNDIEVADYVYHGPEFTWYNNYDGRPLFRRLDRQMLLTEPNDTAIHQHKEALDELQHLRSNDESFYKQKSRVLCLKDGDSNTGYFHKTMKVRQKRNTIRLLISAFGERLETYEQMKIEAVATFKSLWGIEMRTCRVVQLNFWRIFLLILQI
ncbi:Endonuclease/exonuclease/phosphatase [Corchorus olitorius]|uniref:Endonuclease/exonuclease/phosphatase n=1 Tax=Corchorus olitorius TaxID=93759 RepID=A0A1R3KKL6_9ROSI|nr:Endonuclease/exonuclease/phosphatase [Corchorus olitorius]